jgi:hypothetical protein
MGGTEDNGLVRSLQLCQIETSRERLSGLSAHCEQLNLCSPSDDVAPRHTERLGAVRI